MSDALKLNTDPMKSMVRVFDPAKNHGYYGVLLKATTGAGQRAVLVPRHGLVHATPTTTVYRLTDKHLENSLGPYIRAEAEFKSTKPHEGRISPHDIGLLYFRSTTDLSDLPGWDIMSAIEAPPTNVYGADIAHVYCRYMVIQSATRTVGDVTLCVDSASLSWYDEMRWAVPVTGGCTAMIGNVEPVPRAIRTAGGAFPVRAIPLGTTIGCSGGMVYSPKVGTFGMVICGNKSQDSNDNLTLLETLSSLQLTCRMSRFFQL